MCEHTNEGGLAKNHDGSLADIPREVVSDINNDLLEVMTLLCCARHESDQLCGFEEDDGLTNSASRAMSLILMAEERVRASIRATQPYV